MGTRVRLTSRRRGTLLIESSLLRPRNALRRLRLNRPSYRGAMVGSRPSRPSYMMYSNQPMSFRDSMMAGLLLVLVTRILKRESVMRKSSDDTMRPKRLANITGGLYGREYYNSILYVSLGFCVLMVSIGVRVLEVSMRWSLLSMLCSLLSRR